MNLSDDFTLSEAEKSQTAVRLGIHNAVPDELLPAVRLVATEILQPVRNHFEKAFSPSSWYRSKALCLAIGSSVTSQHAKGEAADFEVPGIDNYLLAEWIVENLTFDQLILEFYKPDVPNRGWVHCSIKPDGNRGEVLWFDGKTYRFGLPK